VLGVFHDNYCLAVRRRASDGATVERKGLEGKSILGGLRWNPVVDCKSCFDKITYWEKAIRHGWVIYRYVWYN